MTSPRASFDLSVVVHAATDKALLLNETGECDGTGKPVKGVWIPRSEMDLAEAMELKLARWEDDRRRGMIVLEITIPEWLAYEKGLM